MKYFLAIAIAVVLLGCGTTSSVKIDAPIADQLSFVFMDKRPADSRLARNDTRPEAVGLYYGDDNVSPPPVELLKTWLQKNIGNDLAKRTVTLNDFSISVYEPPASVDQNALGAASASVPGGILVAPLAGLMIEGIERSKSYKTVRIVIKGSVDHGGFSVILSESYQGRVTEANIKKTLLAALDKTVIEVKHVSVGQK